MCGRFALTLPTDAMAQLFDASPANLLPNLPNFNICPTTAVHAVKSGPLGRQLVSMRWGFLPDWYETETSGPLLINARAETIAEKPAFAAACRARRVLVPADGFYEWTQDETGARLPWYIRRRDEAPITFAGIWQSWQGQEHSIPIETCALVTTPANHTIGAIHHRMPLVLEPDQWSLWLGEEGHGAARLMRPGAEGILAAHRVDPEVNSNRAKGAQLCLPFEPGQTPRGKLL